VGKDGAKVDDVIHLDVVECECQCWVLGCSCEPVICIVVGEGVERGGGVRLRDREGEASEVDCDMSGDVLENLWGLCFTKEAGGEIV